MEERFIREKKELAYHAHIFDVYNDYLILPDGQKVIYDLIDHIPGCCVLPVDENGQLIFVRQYRNALDDMTLEVPAGCMDKGETPEQCIRRELKEETGLDLISINKINSKDKLYLSPGMTDESVAFVYCLCDGEITDKYQEDDSTIGLLGNEKIEGYSHSCN